MAFASSEDLTADAILGVVGSDTERNYVSAIGCPHRVIPGAREDAVASLPVAEGIPADSTLDSVVARAALYVIRALSSEDYVASKTAADYVLSTEPSDDVVSAASFDEVAFWRTNDRVRPRGAPNHPGRITRFTESRRGSR